MQQQRFDRLEAELAEQFQHLADKLAARQDEAPEDRHDDNSERYDYQRRYELALEDLRDLKAQNAELEQQLIETRSAAPAGHTPAGAALDWEAEKQRIVAALEPDFHKDSEHARSERLEIERVIQVTDRVIAEKDREIAQLKQLVESPGSSLEATLAEEPARKKILDSDEIVRQEREKLKKAEIKISIERAEIARQRAEIEQKLRTLDRQGGRPETDSDDAEQVGKPVRGRWLARLGLKDMEEE